MKKIITLLSIILINNIGNSQTLDYSNYTPAFFDDFNGYGDPAVIGIHGFKSNPFFVQKYSVENGSWGGQVRYRPLQATMPMQSIIRLTETKLLQPYSETLSDGTINVVKYNSGYLRLNPDYNDKYRNYGYGIIEASIKFPAAVSLPQETCEASFWLWGHKHTEIDIFDVSFTTFYNTRAIDWSYSDPYGKSITNQPFTTPALPNITSGFHKFSAEWTPSIVRFYVDDHFVSSIPYNEIRTYPYFYALELALMPYLQDDYGSGQFMEIDWIQMWKRECEVEDMIVTDPFSSPFNQIQPASGREFIKEKVIISSGPLLNLFQTVPTKIVAEATEINANFLADQSVLTYQSPVPIKDNNGNITHYIHPYSNAYLEITPKTCALPPSKPGRSHNDNSVFDNSYEGMNYIRNDTLYKKKSTSNSLRNTIGNIRIYPNPSTGSFNIEIPQKGNYTIRVMNLIGSTVYEGKMTDEQKKAVQLDQNLPPGNYTIHISGDGLRHVEKITLVR